jgi:hypothetical protein
MLGMNRSSAARPGALETFEVVLNGLAPTRAATLRIIQTNHPAPRIADNRQAESPAASSDTTEGADSPLVEARHDVAGLDNPNPHAQFMVCPPPLRATEPNVHPDR